MRASPNSGSSRVLFPSSVIKAGLASVFISSALYAPVEAKEPAHASPKEWTSAVLIAKVTTTKDGSPQIKPLDGSFHIDKPVPMASLAKMMTAYLVLEAVRSGKLGLDQRISIPKEANNLVFSRFSNLPGRVHDITVREAFVAMNSQSNNITTYALAVAVAGSEEHFVAMMNKKAVEMGLVTTRFLTSTGLPVMPDHQSEKDRRDPMTTVTEISKVGCALHRHFPEYEELLSDKKPEVNGQPLKVGPSSTAHLGFDDYEGGKSGTLSGCSSAVVILKRDFVLAVACAKNWIQRNGLLRKGRDAAHKSATLEPESPPTPEQHPNPS